MWLNMGNNLATERSAYYADSSNERFKNTVEIERRCAESNEPVFVKKMVMEDLL